jgi:hypothetical protein
MISQTAKLIQKRDQNKKFNFLLHQTDRDSDVQYKYRYLSNGALHMKSKYRAKKLRATSVDSKLTPDEQFKRLIYSEPAENITFINWQRHIYQIELNYPSMGIGSYIHLRITYCVIARQSKCCTVIKVKNIVKFDSKLRRLIKIRRHSKKQSLKWIPRVKTRY